MRNNVQVGRGVIVKSKPNVSVVPNVETVADRILKDLIAKGFIRPA